MPKTGIILTICAVAVICITAAAQKKTTNYQSMNEMETLDLKWQDMVAIACLEAKGDVDRLAQAIRNGLDSGLTVNQIKEALSQLYAYTGFPRSLNGLGVLQRISEARKAEGIKDDEGQDAEPLPKDYNALKYGTEVQTQLTGGKPFNYTFAPATDYYLKAHLFGDIFARNNLSFAERELVTISALCGLKGVESQLASHVRGARNMGLSDTAIRAIPQILRQKVGDLEAYRAGRAISKVFGEPFTEGEPIENRIFPKSEPNTAYANYFIGNSYLAPLTEGTLPLHNVTFEPGCRNNWHIHHKGGQILICVGGRGWYQEWGEPARALKPGDVVNIPAEVKHWHGAASDSWFQHIAIAVPAEGASTEWCEPVTDEEYKKCNQ